jgi:glycosyltransferase involved in cell wall biosynthesis
MAPNGVDFKGVESILATLPEPTAHRWGQIVSVGNLYRLKGVHENLQAMRRLLDCHLTDWHYTIVGDGPYRTELEELVRTLELSQNVSFAGRVSHQEAIRLIYEADIFCLPSFLESFGNVYAEAALCGKPSIGCRRYGAEIMIEHQRTGLLVEPQDVDSLTDALAFLLTHPDDARQMGQNAAQHIRTFTWEKTAGTYQNIFERVISAYAAN